MWSVFDTGGPFCTEQVQQASRADQSKPQGASAIALFGHASYYNATQAFFPISSGQKKRMSDMRFSVPRRNFPVGACSTRFIITSRAPPNYITMVGNLRHRDLEVLCSCLDLFWVDASDAVVTGTESPPGSRSR